MEALTLPSVLSSCAALYMQCTEGNTTVYNTALSLLAFFILFRKRFEGNYSDVLNSYPPLLPRTFLKRNFVCPTDGDTLPSKTHGEKATTIMKFTAEKPTLNTQQRSDDNDETNSLNRAGLWLLASVVSGWTLAVDISCLEYRKFGEWILDSGFYLGCTG